MNSSGGDGHGQCVDAEIYLCFLDVSKAKARRISHILIGSCNKQIEQAEINLSDYDFGGDAVNRRKLSPRFLLYNEVEEKLVGATSADYRRLML